MKDGRARTLPDIPVFSIEAFGADLAEDFELQAAYDDVLELIELLDAPGFWDDKPLHPRIIISVGGSTMSSLLQERTGL